MKTKLAILILVLIGFKILYADNYPRNYNIDIIHYTFRIGLSDSTNKIICQSVIRIKFLKDNVFNFNLDLVGKSNNSITGMIVSSVTENNNKVGFHQNPDNFQIELKLPPKKGTEKIFTIDYSGIPADGLIISKNKFGQRTFFGDNWPNRAHYWLPTIDHPYDKAACDFIVIAPDKYQVIANGLLQEETDLTNGTRLTHWKETTPISTELMVIGAAQFAVQYLPEINCIPVESWVYPQDRSKGFYDFSIATNIIKFFSSLIGPFPFHKLANVESRTKYGGMENAGNIFYAESSITGTRKNESTIAHEIAHQWFGDAVTEADWNHLWLSEGFATFFEDVFIENQFGKDSLYHILNYDKDLILNYDNYNPGSAVVDTSIKDLNLLLNPNTYQKGAWVLRMLRNLIGEKKFWNGIKDYYTTYRNKNVLTSNFEKIMEKDSGMNLKWFFDQWIYHPGIPDVNGTWHYNKSSGKLLLTFFQDKPGNTVFRLPFDIEINFNGSKDAQIKHILLDKKENKFEFTLDKNPESITLDPGHYVLMQAVLRNN